MDVEANKALVRRYFDEIVSHGILEAVDELFHPEFHSHGAPPDAPRGTERVKTVWRNWRAAFPDWTAAVEFQVAESDLVATRITAQGKQTGELRHPRFGVIPATGRYATVTATVTFRLRDGKLYENWESGDFLGFFQQLGVVQLVAQPLSTS
ncbi:MAG TPA: ester cyclase [Dehalococcoidia bacterium]|nr:ester cyclase [Dehalococcoidia bacterium]